MLLTLKTLWPATILQRCRFHAWLNVKAKLTLHPESIAGQQLLVLTRELLHVHRKREARIRRWYRKHHGYINQRTINPKPAKSGATPTTGYGVLTASCTNYGMICCVPATGQAPA